MSTYQDIDIIVSTTLPTIDKLREYKNGPDALFLYFRYVKQARLQKTNTTYSKDSFMAEWMKRSMNKFYKAKKILIDNNLIETITRFWKDWKITWKFVKINFIIQETGTSDSEVTTLSKNHPMEKPSDGKMTANALSNKINAWSNKLNTKPEAINLVYENYTKRVPKDKRKYIKSAQCKKYIEQLLKEFSLEELVESANNYFRKTDSMYIMAPQYFYSNTMKGKQYRVFVDFVKEKGVVKPVMVTNKDDLF